MNASKHITAAFAAIMATNQLNAAVVNITSGSTSGYTMTDGNTYVVQNSVSFSNSTAGGSGMSVADNATVVLYVPAGVTLTAKGGNGSGQTGGGAGIRVPSTATLIITGEGAVNATGGNAGNGGKGSDGKSGGEGIPGVGGDGGAGGGGAGAAIGGNGGRGGAINGQAGYDAESMGYLYLLGDIVSLNAAGESGLAGSQGAQGKFTSDLYYDIRDYYGGGGGGGGGGAGAMPSSAIGGGGSSGGGGGMGTNGSASLNSSHAHSGETGAGGKSQSTNGEGSSGNAGGAYGAEGGAGTLYVSPTATVNVNRTTLSATTHAAAQYIITFNAKGGTIPSSSNTVAATLGCTLPDPIPAATKDGYLLVGWAEESTEGTMWYGSDGTKMLSSYTSPSNTTLYAIWQIETPVISPTGGIVPSWPLSVTISSSTEGAVIHYTTDGSEPTAESPVYRRFRISGRTTVKAIAVKDGNCSNVAVAEYVGGLCANPVITAASSFTGGETQVSISCVTEGATIHYTLDGNDPNSHSAHYAGSFYVTNSCIVKAYAVYPDYYDSMVVSQTITKVWGIGDTLGAPDHAFTTGGNLPFVRVMDSTAPLGESMKSGAITHNQTSTISTTVMGPGTISFKWKASCEDDPLYEWDHAEFLVDGNIVAWLCGETAWQTVTQSISGDGVHTLLWRYVKDVEESEGEDCCWVAGYLWASDYTATRTSETPVPYDWLRDFFPHTHDEYDSYESTALADAANGENKIWECYVAGISPTNETQVFRAVISWENGKPKIGWSPDLNENGAKNERIYRVFGAKSLDHGAEWKDVTDLQDYGAEQSYRFFRVKVEMP